MNFLGVLLVIGSVITFLISMGGEVVSMLVSPLLMIIGVTLIGMVELCHMDDEKMREIAVEALKEEKENILIREYRDELETFYLSLSDIYRNRDKIRSTIDNLRNKSKQMSNEQARQIFNRKIEQLEKQCRRLDGTRSKLEHYAYEQLLVNYAKTLEGEGLSAGVDYSGEVQRELETVKSVMDEVEKISRQ
ncbi:MAG: hypothetical protein IJB89_09690 [Akkermansia sp.]|nr:hypothetical protein [Akkermansia sp.]